MGEITLDKAEQRTLVLLCVCVCLATGLSGAVAGFSVGSGADDDPAEGARSGARLLGFGGALAAAVWCLMMFAHARRYILGAGRGALGMLAQGFIWALLAGTILIVIASVVSTRSPPATLHAHVFRIAAIGLVLSVIFGAVGSLVLLLVAETCRQRLLHRHPAQ